MRTLASIFADSAARYPDKEAVEDPVRGCGLTYRQLDLISNEIRNLLLAAGVAPGDRVGLYAAKSCGSLAAVLATLKAGAAYVPVDYTAPPQRNAFIFRDCAVAAVVVDTPIAEALVEALGDGVHVFGCSRVHVTTPVGHADELGCDLSIVACRAGEAVEAVEEVKTREAIEALDPGGPVDGGLSYILYTSGSTGKPKGVMHTHASALSFVDWCSDVFLPNPSDKFSSHASFHFDLSILDIYVPLKHGSSIVLIGEAAGKNPAALAPLIASTGITIWYSTPSILRLLAEGGNLGEYDYSALRVVNFAGEVFPIKHFRAIKSAWPHPRYLNLYGPTETNVCTSFEVPRTIADDRREPFPIGYVCSNDRIMVADDDGTPVEPGQPGELLVTGGSVMTGYWNLPDRTAGAYFVDDDGVRWYRTGDVVTADADGCCNFVGRRDRMVKRRGYRIELGEIESALYRHENIREAAVVSAPDEENGVVITAFVCTNDGERVGLIAMKRFCSENLPLYMIPDRFNFRDALPKTATDKIDYQQLLNLA